MNIRFMQFISTPFRSPQHKDWLDHVPASQCHRLCVAHSVDIGLSVAFILILEFVVHPAANVDKVRETHRSTGKVLLKFMLIASVGVG